MHAIIRQGNGKYYGERIIADLADRLTEKYGSGFDRRSLYRYAQFYQLYPEIVVSLRPQSSEQKKEEIAASLSSQSISGWMNITVKENLLSWTHYRTLLQVDDDHARRWYEKEAFDQAWSVRTLQRNISTAIRDTLLPKLMSGEIDVSSIAV